MEEENKNGDQEPSVWDKVEAGATKRSGDSVWDRVEANQEDPQKSAMNWTLERGAATPDPKRAARVIRLANRFKLPEPFADKNLDRLEEEERKGNFASEDLVNQNPTLARAISESPNYSAAALQHLPALKRLEMLYTRPPELWPQSDETLQQRARKAAKLLADRNWTGKPLDSNVFPRTETGYVDPQFAASRDEMEDVFYKRELDELRHEEQIIGGGGQVGLLESIKNVATGNHLFAVPVVSRAKGIMEKAGIALSKEAVRNNQADDIDRYVLDRAARLEGAANLRGKSFWGYLGEAGASFPSMAGEMMMGGAIGGGAKALFGLSGTSFGAKTAGALLEASAGAATSGAAGGMEAYQQYKGAGDSGGAAAAKASRDVFADYLGGQLFGPWFAKAPPEAQALVKQSLLGAIPKEALKMVGMTAASDLMKTVGPDMAEHLKDSLVSRAINGDPEAWKELGAQAAIGGISGAGHTAIRNAAIDNAKARAKAFADASLDRAGLLESLIKEVPEIAGELSAKLSTGGHNEFMLVPVQAFIEHYGDSAHIKAGEIIGDRSKFENARASGADIVIPTAVYDHTIGADPAARKFFSDWIRPEPGVMNLKEATALEKAYAAGIRTPARERIVQQIAEQAKGDKVTEALGVAELAKGDEKVLYDTLGLSDQQIATIGQALGKARAAAREHVNEREIERRDKLKGELYEKEKGRITEEVTKEVDARQEQVALARLQDHQLPGGEPLATDVPKIKLSRQALEDAGYKVSSLPKGVVSDGNFAEGTHVYAMTPEDAAASLGFKSGHDLLLALGGLHGKAREEAIKYESDSRMAQKFPLGLQPAELPQAAMDALHNKHSAELQRLTLQYIVENKLSALKDMAKAATRKVPKLAEVTEGANKDIRDNYTVATLNPKLFLEAEHAAKREALAAATTGRWEDVFDWKLKELHAHERYRAATEAAEALKKTSSAWRELPDKGYLNKGTTGDWNQQIKDLLRRIGLIAVEPKDLAGMKPFTEWAKEKFDSGETRFEPINIDPRFANQEFTTSFRDMTYGDVLSLKDTIDRLSHLAKDIDSVHTEAGRVALDSWNREFSGNVRANFEKLPPPSLTESGKSYWERLVSWARRRDASLDRPESFFDRLDGGNIEGPVNRVLWNGQVDARVKYADLRRQFVDGVRRATEEMPAEIRRRLDDKIQIAGVKIPISRREIMGLVANGGNESNFSKMVRGEEVRGMGLTVEKIQEAAKHLTEAEKDFVQKITDVTNSFWGEIEALHKWATGKPPEKIEAKQMIEAMGDRPGGYYPAMYSGDYSKVGEIQVAGEIGKLTGPSFQRATTDAGYRESRVESFAAPMDYNFGRLASHIDSMAKDIAFRKWLLDVNKIVSNPDVMATVRDHLGPEYRDYMRDWVKRVIGEGGASDKTAAVWSQMVGTMRHNAMLATLALKPSVFLKNALGVGPAIAEIGHGWFAKGYKEFLSAPRDTFERMKAESPEMAHFLETYDTNVRESLRRLESKTGALADVQRFAMQVIPLGNLMLTMPTYLGAKAKAIAEFSAKGKTGAELDRLAVRSAEKAVRKSVGSGNPGDIPAVMGSEGMKLLLMFYTPGSVLYSQMKDTIKSGDVSKMLIKGFWLIPFAATMNYILSGKTPDEERDETYLGNIGKEIVTSPFSAIPMGSNLADKAYDAASGQGADFDVDLPAFRAMEQTFKTIDKGADWWRDEAEFEDVFRQMFKASGYWFGAPTEQADITGGYLYDLMRDRSDPNDIFEFAHDLLWRRPKSRRPQ